MRLKFNMKFVWRRKLIFHFFSRVFNEKLNYSMLSCKEPGKRVHLVPLLFRPGTTLMYKANSTCWKQRYLYILESHMYLAIGLYKAHN